MGEPGEPGRLGGPRWPRRFALAAQVGGGVLLVASLTGPLTAHGPGSALPIRATADLLLSGTVAAWAPRWVGLALYTPPVLGAGLLASAGARSRSGRRVAGGLAALAVLLVVAMTAAVGRGLPWRAGRGYTLVAVGTVLAVLGAVGTVVTDRATITDPTVEPTGEPAPS